MGWLVGTSDDIWSTTRRGRGHAEEIDGEDTSELRTGSHRDNHDRPGDHTLGL